ncbi:MAG: hypothetical protein ACOC3X_00015 [Nanoarchaeota archaeon]
MRKKEEIKLKDEKVPFLKSVLIFIKIFFLSLYPDNYHKFTDKRIKDIAKYFFSLILLIFLLINILLIVKSFLFINSLDDRLNYFNNLSIDINMNLTEDIYLLNDNVKITQQGNYSGEFMFISNEKIAFKKKECLIIPALCIFNNKHKEIKTNELKDILNFKDEINSLIIFLTIVFIPIISIFITFFILIKVILLILLIFILIKILSLLTKFKITNKKLLFIVIYASTMYLIIEPFNLLIINTYYIHLGLFIIYTIIGLFLIGEKRHRF